jgi:hypothetical protein
MRPLRAADDHPGSPGSHGSGMAEHNPQPDGVAASRPAGFGSARSGPHNIGARPEDLPRSLNVDFGGEGSATDRLWKRYRTELGETSKRRGDTAQRRRESIDQRDPSKRGFWSQVQRLIHAPV